MPWWRLPSGMLWWGHIAPAGAQPATAPTRGVPVDDPSDVVVDDLTERDVVGAGVEVDVVPQVEQEVQVGPGAVGGARGLEHDRAEPVTKLMDLTVSDLRDRARNLGLEIPAHVRKTALVDLIHEAETTT